MSWCLSSLRKKYLLHESADATMLLQGKLVPLKKCDVVLFETENARSGKKWHSRPLSRAALISNDVEIENLFTRIFSNSWADIISIPLYNIWYKMSNSGRIWGW